MGSCAYLRRMKRFFFWVVVSLMVVQIPVQAAISLVSNLGNAGAATVIFSPGSVYQSFQVGSSGATISSVNLAFGSVANPTGVRVFLLLDNSSAPGASLGNFSLDGLPASISGGSPAFTGSFNLLANTRYWIEVANTAGGQSDISYTTDVSETGQTGWSMGNSFLWDFGAVTSGSIRMAITGTPSSVPEPSSITLLALGLGALAFHRRRS